MSNSPALSRGRRVESAAQRERGRQNVQAIREEHEANQDLAMRRQIEMANRDKAQVGFLRADLSPIEAAMEQYDELSAALDDAVDVLEKAFQRERQAARVSGPDESDLRRAPVLGNRRGGGAR